MSAGSYIKGMVFGVFDGLHEGHAHFLRDAKARCGELVVVVASDESARGLKGHAPHESLAARMAAVCAFDASLHVVEGDEVPGSWHILASETPDMIFLGYDQQALAGALKERGVPFQFLSAHEPERFKSSILNSETAPHRGE